MNRLFTIITGVGLAAGLVVGCGSGNDNSTGSLAAPSGGTTSSSPSSAPSSAPTTGGPQSLNTAGVLALAKVQSETATPFAVDNGSLTLTDTSETTTPVAINGP